MKMRAIVISKDEGGQQVEVTDVNEDDLPEGDVTVRIDYSSLNYSGTTLPPRQDGVSGVP